MKTNMYEIKVEFLNKEYDFTVMEKLLFVTRSYVEPMDRNDIRVYGDETSRTVLFRMNPSNYRPLFKKLRKILSSELYMTAQINRI
jgi:hypothetical protein